MKCNARVFALLLGCLSLLPVARANRLLTEEDLHLTVETEAHKDQSAKLNVARRHVLSQLKSVSESSSVAATVAQQAPATTAIAADAKAAPSAEVEKAAQTLEEAVVWPTLYFACVATNWVVVAAVVVGLYYIVSQLMISSVGVSTSAASIACSWGPFILIWYCFFSVSHTFYQHNAAHVTLNPVVPTILIYLMKLVLALMMYRCSDGTFGDLYTSLRKNTSAVLWYLLPAACLAFYDLLSFMTLARLSPAQYQILLHLRTVLIALVWQVVMAKKLTTLQWVLLFSCVYAALLTEREALNALVVGGGLATTLGPYATLSMQYGLSITGNLSNEKFLKQVELTVNAQNILLYSLGALILTLLLVCKTVVQGPVFTAQDFPKILDTNVLMSIITLGLVGISTGFVLKLMGNIWKELAGMVVTFTAAAIDWFVLRSRKVDVIDCQAVAIVSLSLAIYSLLEKKMAQDQQNESIKAALTAEQKLAGAAKNG